MTIVETTGVVTSVGRNVSRRVWLLSIAAVSAFAILVIGTYIPDQRPLSPFDEWVYLDYVDKMAHFDVPQTGETIDREALEVSSCRGVFVWGEVGSPCGGPYVSTDYPLAGITSADVHPPTYFAANAALAGVVRSIGLSDDVLTSNRVIGALWLAIGLWLVLVLAHELGAPLSAGVGIAGVVASLPIVRYTNSYITPDTLNLAIGALALLTALRVSRDRWPWWSMAVVGALAGFVKTQNGLVLGATTFFLLWFYLLDRRARPGEPPASRCWKAAAGSVVAFIGTQIVWTLTRRLLSLDSAPSHGGGTSLTLDLLVRETGAFILRLGLGATEDGQPIPSYAYFSTALLIAGCVGATLYRSVRDERWAVAASVTLLVFIGSPLLIVAQQFVLAEVVPSPTRYGASLLAGIAAVTATAFSTRYRSAALAGFGTLVVFLVVGQNLAR